MLIGTRITRCSCWQVLLKLLPLDPCLMLLVLSPLQEIVNR
jgi:hypothetical protein